MPTFIGQLLQYCSDSNARGVNREGRESVALWISEKGCVSESLLDGAEGCLSVICPADGTVQLCFTVQQEMKQVQDGGAVSNQPSVVVGETTKFPQFLCSRGTWKLDDFFHMRRWRRDPMGIHAMTKEAPPLSNAGMPNSLLGPFTINP